MRSRIITLALVLVAGISLFSLKAYDSNEETKNQLLIRLIVQSLNANHYSPYEIDDDFSERVYDKYLDRLDYNKRFFTVGDVEKMDVYKKELDNQVLNSDFEFFELSMDILEQRLEMVKGYYKEILIQAFDFTVDEELNLDNKKIEWAKGEAELKDRWRKLLKYQVMSRVSSKMDNEDGDDEEEEAEEKSFDDLEEAARQKVMKSFNDWERRIDKLDRSDRRATFLNAIASTYDPHTSYFPPKDKENFDIQMSGRLEGIGATLREKDGYIQVVKIVPGSPSYLQGELAEDDLILKVAQGDEEPVDVVDMRLDDAVQLIRGKKGTEARLTVKKVDESVKVIPIVRDVVILAATYAKSAIIQNEHTGKNKIGYIKLPKFYADFHRKDGRRCATDVAAEVEKLKAENISGLVLDLRNNGGGSLMDVVEMAGLFIENGPIVQIKGRYGAPQVLSDRDNEVQYDGPLVILVNSSSASASEIMAAAIQDYKRGIIIGTPTFGKGTVQRFYGLDNFLRGEATEFKPLGDIKLTTQKFYRVNGGATQLKGVTPDVILPDAFSFIDRGEKLIDYAMPWDEIPAADYKVWGIDAKLYGSIRGNSRKRTNNHEKFDLVVKNAMRLKKQRENKVRSLNFESFRTNESVVRAEAKKYKDIMEPIMGTKVANLPSDLEKMGADTVLVQLNEDWFKKLRKDIYIDEALTVLSEMD